MSEDPTKVCLTIAGLDPSGGAGIIADIRTFTAFGCYAAAAITSLTFQNTAGVFGAAHQTPETVRSQLEPVFADLDVDAVKTGMLPTAGIIRAVAELLRNNNVKYLVVDPVVRSTSGFDLIDDNALRVLVEELFPLAAVITPNIPEAERITNIDIRSVDDISRAAERLQSKGARNVLVKGGHFESDDYSNDYLFAGSDVEVFVADRIKTSATHGTGCTLSSAIAANLALEHDLKQSIGIAKRFVTEAIKSAPNIGHGNSPINHLVKLK
jgi:hydroxymethylpyrimidine/phosphomethylpyrimidine kinase